MNSAELATALLQIAAEPKKNSKIIQQSMSVLEQANSVIDYDPASDTNLLSSPAIKIYRHALKSPYGPTALSQISVLLGLASVATLVPKAPEESYAQYFLRAKDELSTQAADQSQVIRAHTKETGQLHPMSRRHANAIVGVSALSLLALGKFLVDFNTNLMNAAKPPNNPAADLPHLLRAGRDMIVFCGELYLAQFAIRKIQDHATHEVWTKLQDNKDFNDFAGRLIDDSARLSARLVEYVDQSTTLEAQELRTYISTTLSNNAKSSGSLSR